MELALYFIFLIILPLIFASWTIINLIHKPPYQKPVSKKWFLGVCSDYSSYVNIPLWVVRLYAIVFSPLIIGPIFYFFYYWILQKRLLKKTTEISKEVIVTKIDSHHY